MNGMAVSAPPILKTLKTKDMIAKTILQQIGGKRFTAMTGSRDFIDMGNGLRMSLSRNKTSANRLDIIYDEGADLYNMRFYRRTFSKKTFGGVISCSFENTFVPLQNLSLFGDRSFSL